MASGKDYLNYILEQLSGLDGITYRAMMGEYIFYIHNRIAGGIYDDRLLIKPVRAARERLPDAPMESPYAGAKPMLLVDRVDDADFMRELFTAIYAELPEPRKKKQ